MAYIDNNGVIRYTRRDKLDYHKAASKVGSKYEAGEFKGQKRSDFSRGMHAEKVNQMVIGSARYLADDANREKVKPNQRAWAKNYLEGRKPENWNKSKRNFKK